MTLGETHLLVWNRLGAAEAMHGVAHPREAYCSMATKTRSGQGGPGGFRAIVRGRVQGVNFRYYTRVKASSLGLVGYVRNLSLGRVEVVAEGREHSLRRLLSWLHVGPPLAHVSHVRVQWCSPEGDYRCFEVRY